MGITPKDPADFTPDMGSYTDLKPFRFWCQKVLPLVYDDSLSYYEVLCKVVDYLNKSMEDVGVLHDDVDALNTAYQQLQAYVNDYFSTLDVQQEINNKLDVMASDGTLDALLLPYFNAYKADINQIVSYQNTEIDNFKNTVNTNMNVQNQQITTLEGRMDSFARLTEGSTTGDAELQDIRVGANGITYSTAGDAVRGQYTENHNGIDHLKGLNYPTTLFKDKIISNVDGTMQPIDEGYSATDKILVYDARELHIHTDRASIYNAFYDSNGTFISSFTVQIGDNTISIPNNTYSFAMSNKSNYMLTTEIKLPALINTLIDINKTVQSIGLATTDTDMNALPNNVLININSPTLTANVNHVPYDGFSGTIMTLCGSRTQTAIKCQIAISGTMAVGFYWRQYYNSWSEWFKVENKNSVVMDGVIPVTTDLNNLRNGTVVNINAGTFTAATNHVPVDGFNGTVITLCGKEDQSQIRCQLAISGSMTNAFYWRQYYSSSWSAWSKVVNKDCFTLDGVIPNTTDLNDLAIGSVVNINSGSFTVTDNHVPYDGFSGTVITLCGKKDQNVIKSQIAIAGTPTYGFYWRQYYTSWGSWVKIASEDYVNSAITGLASPLNVLNAFSNITCCGDSLTYSQVYTSASESRQAYKTYPECLEEQIGVSVEALASAGYSASNWWNAYQNSITSKSNHLAIIYLGTNAGLTDTLDTDAPEEDPYTEWADTNTGNFAKIIAKFQSVGAKVMLVKIYATSGTGDSGLDTTNHVIEEAAARFNCGLCNNTYLADVLYHYYPDLSGSNGTHYNDLGYSAFTNQLINSVANMDKNYLKYMIPA